ncbi:MAG: GDP-L-fucose synthase [Akkermansiaceae bacterium]|nr:GDP-L-fucose synthase [Akkermansiaceae bacterium]
MLTESDRIYVAGHRGMVGGALLRRLESDGFRNVVTATSAELDLRRQEPVEAFLAEKRPDAVIIAAAKVGGIHANDSYPADFLYDNLMIAANLVEAAWRTGVRRLLFLGSTCIYPKHAPQPIPEDSLLTGPLEPTNEAYAVAKIAGLKLCEYYRRQHGCIFHSAMPCNLYGPGDNYHPENSHVIPALLRRFHEAKEAGASEVVLWGTGTPLREFLHVDDLAAGVLHLLGLEDPPDLVNIGTGSEISIRDLAELVAEVVGFEGKLVQDTGKPDGTPRKVTDNSLIRSFGWEPRIPLREGLVATYRDFQQEAAGGGLRTR